MTQPRTAKHDELVRLAATIRDDVKLGTRVYIEDDRGRAYDSVISSMTTRKFAGGEWWDRRFHLDRGDDSSRMACIRVHADQTPARAYVVDDGTQASVTHLELDGDVAFTLRGESDV